jgi:glyceraldehyde-3-phosphate dehydrogenase/erythrose-4-phosphate dehydrogenase
VVGAFIRERCAYPGTNTRTHHVSVAGTGTNTSTHHAGSDSTHSNLRYTGTDNTCSNNLISSTGAAKAVPKIIPSLKGKLTANAVRVPTPNASLAILQLQLSREVTVEEVKDERRDRPKTSWAHALPRA